MFFLGRILKYLFWHVPTTNHLTIILFVGDNKFATEILPQLLCDMLK